MMQRHSPIVIFPKGLSPGLVEDLLELWQGD